MNKFLVKWKNESDGNGIRINCSDACEAKRIFLKGKQGNEDEVEVILIKDESSLTEEDKRQQEEQKKQKQLEVKLAKQRVYEDISGKLQDGPQNLNLQELNLLSAVVKSLVADEELEEIERKLAWKALKDPAFVNYIQVKQSSQSLIQQNSLLEKLGVQLSKISSNSSSIKTTNLVSGMLAARYLGEEMADDFGGED